MTDDERKALGVQKARARRAVRTALMGGRLQRPDACSRCKQTPRRGTDGRTLIHAHHHHGYDHPLAVEWLCVVCHCEDDPRPKGERNGFAKLNTQTVLQIRADSRSGRVIARDLGISRTIVGQVKRGERWGHVA